jgi:hypothetical protein
VALRRRTQLAPPLRPPSRSVLPGEHVLRLSGSPRNRGNAAQSDPGLPHLRADHVYRHCGGGEGKLIGLPIANLEIERAPCPRAPGTLISVMRSPGARTVSTFGVAPGNRCRAEKRMVRTPPGPATLTVASSAISSGQSLRDNSLCSRDYRQELRVVGLNHPLRCSWNRDRACCTRSRRYRENTGTGSAAAHCRQASPCCEVGRSQPAASSKQRQGSFDNLRMVGCGRHLDHGAKPYAVG